MAKISFSFTIGERPWGPESLLTAGPRFAVYTHTPFRGRVTHPWAFLTCLSWFGDALSMLSQDNEC